MLCSFLTHCFCSGPHPSSPFSTRRPERLLCARRRLSRFSWRPGLQRGGVQLPAPSPPSLAVSAPCCLPLHVQGHAGALASSCPTECGTGGVGLKCSPEGRREGMVPSAPVWVGGQDGLLPFGLAAPNFRSPLHPPGIRMMSPGEQWPLHGSSWGQKLGPESVPLGETWSDTPGRTKGLAAPQGSASVK